MRILDLEFNVILENERMKKMGSVEAEGIEDIYCYDQFVNPEVCGTDSCTLKQLVEGGEEEIQVEVEKKKLRW